MKSGEKTFEIRNDDRGFQRGEVVTLRYFDKEYLDSHPDIVVSSKREEWDGFFEPLRFRIGFVYYLDSSRVVFSLLEYRE